MSPCCAAAAAATAALTALIVAGLSAFVLVTDGFGLGLLVATLLAAALQAAGLIGPCPRLLHAFCALLAGRAAWLLAAERRPLVVATFRFVRRRASWVALHLTPLGRFGRARVPRPGPTACPRCHSAREPIATGPHAPLAHRPVAPRTDEVGSR